MAHDDYKTLTHCHAYPENNERVSTILLHLLSANSSLTLAVIDILIPTCKRLNVYRFVVAMSDSFVKDM